MLTLGTIIYNPVNDTVLCITLSSTASSTKMSSLIHHCLSVPSSLLLLFLSIPFCGNLSIEDHSSVSVVIGHMLFPYYSSLYLIPESEYFVLFFSFWLTLLNMPTFKRIKRIRYWRTNLQWASLFDISKLAYFRE